MTDRRWLVDTEWLAARLEAPDIVVVDGSWHLPTAGRDAHAEYLEAHIPGAIFFDIDDIADKSTNLPHMLPSPEAFASRMRKLGVGDGKRVVVYDSVGLFSAPRVWWTFRVMGHNDVVVLDGGLPKWQAEGRPVESGPVRRQERHFTARRHAGMVADLDDVRRAVASGEAEIVDARSAERFEGRAPEPRPGLKSGHIPGSRNLPYSRLLTPDGRLKPREELEAAFAEARLDLSRPLITSCGSGVSAAILSLALAELGHRRTALYDGSWAEWGGRDDTPIATGPDGQP
ncbi:MAG: 3-mercaptopyruvate sulfurtransferase [Pseudomonadota bacterium]|nr:3-mercaptopyruvate sulfurtransferase [Pseudomonadota bacterium]